MAGNESAIYEQGLDSWWGKGAKLSALARLNPARFKYFDTIVPKWEGKRVLDIGCGGGFTSEFLAKRGAQVFGIDPFPKVVDVAKEHARRSNLSIEYQVAAAEHIPFPDESFDAAVCVDVLEHVGDLKKTLTEAHRVLKKGGHLFFDTINKTFLSRVIMILLLENILGVIPKGAHDWNMFIEPERLKQYLAESGFSDIQLKGFSFRGFEKDGNLKFALSEHMPVMYIGSARK